MKIKCISKQVLAIVLSLAVLASALMLNTLSVFATDEGTDITCWNGQAATVDETTGHAYAGGTGKSANDPYLISTGEQLAYLTTTCNYDNTKGKYYKLTDDIYLNDVTDPEWYKKTAKEWLFQDDENKAFSGTLDGDGHTIYGLYIKGNYSRPALFGAVGNTVIKNLRISKAYVSNTKDQNYSSVAVLAACRGGWGTLTISNCVIDDDVQIIGNSGCVGGFIGYIPKNAGTTTIENCYSGAKLTQTATNFASQCLVREFVGGRADGASANLTIKNSYTTGDHEFATSNDTTKPTFENCYTTNTASTEAGVIVRTLAEMTGAKALIYMNTFDFQNVWYTEDGKTPQLRAFNSTADNATELWKVWDGTVPSKPEGVADNKLWEKANVPFDGGSGTQGDPYKISTPWQLAYLCTYANWYTSEYGGTYFELTDDIYLNDISLENWTANNPNLWKFKTDPEPLFYGHLNGNGHTVYGLYINDNLYYTGLIWKLGSGGSVENLKISNSYVRSTHSDGHHGVLIGTTWGNTTVKNCVIDDTVEFTQLDNAAPLIGGIQKNQTTNVTVQDCYVAAKVSKIDNARTNFYGFLGYCPTAYTLDVSNSYYVGDFDLAYPATGCAPTFTGCYTTKVYDPEKGETAPQNVNTLTKEKMLERDELKTVLKVFPMLGNVNAQKVDGKYTDTTIDICDLVCFNDFNNHRKVTTINPYAADINHDRTVNPQDFNALKVGLLRGDKNFQ